MKSASSTEKADKEQALREIGLELPHGEHLMNAVLRLLGLPECRGSYVAKPSSYTSRWSCECGAKTMNDCPSRKLLEDK